LLATIDAALAVLPADRPRNIEAFRALLNRETADLGSPGAMLRPESTAPLPYPAGIPRVNIGASITPPSQPSTTAQPVPPTATRRTWSMILHDAWSALTRKPVWALLAAASALILVAAAWLLARS
jgi:hypothetical protein